MERRSLLRGLGGGLALTAGLAGRTARAEAPTPAPAFALADATARFDCDLATPARPLRHPWRTCVGSCHAPTALRADWQRQIARARAELGFAHVRFHGLLSDDMGTVLVLDDQLVYSFLNIDRVFDFLRSIGMRPVVELSFMPAALASGGDTVFRYRGNVTPPRRMEDWSRLVSTLVGHWVERYGLDEVARWPLEVWNEPNLRAFWTGGQAAYFDLYQASWNPVKAISPRLQVGGPATAANAWLPEFVAWSERNACPPDFLSTHYYPTDAFGNEHSDTVSQLAAAPLSVMRDRAREARAAAGARPLYYTEWNITSNSRDEMHDGPFCAALATRFALDVDDLVDAASWWTFSDIFEENWLPSRPFHGGFGLLTLHDIAKPVYRGFELVARLGSRAWTVAGAHPTVAAWVGGGEDARSSAVLVSNVAMPRHEIRAERVAVRLSGLAGRRPRAATVTRIDESHANPRAAWHAMGSPDYPLPRQVDALQAASALAGEPIGVAGDGATADVVLALPPNAIALVEIDWAA